MLSLEEPTLGNTIGAIVLGMAGAAFFVGVSTLQVYLYYHRFTHDSLLHKYAVAIIWVLDTFHLILVIHAVYFYVVTSFGDFINLDFIVWSVKLQMPVNLILVVIIQSLYAYRVWLLGGYHRGVLGYLSAAAVTTGFVIGMILVVKIYSITTYTEVYKIGWALSATFGISTAIDTTIGGALCYYLWKSRGAHTNLNSKISRLIQYTVGSGLLTSACSVTDLLTWILLPHTLNFLAVGFFLTKLYVCSFFVMLNARDHPREAHDEEARLRVVLPVWSKPNGSPTSFDSARYPALRSKEYPFSGNDDTLDIHS